MEDLDELRGGWAKRLEDISDRKSLSPEDFLAVNLEIGAALYLMAGGDRRQLENASDKFKSIESGQVVFSAVMGAVSLLETKGVHAANAREYIERRLSELEAGPPDRRHTI
jgi:hypothetical protein